MELTELGRQIAAKAGEIPLRFDEPMAKHTSFRIGGGAEIMAFPETAGQLARLLEIGAELGIQP